jgi:hypothetical protein
MQYAGPKTTHCRRCSKRFKVPTKCVSIEETGLFEYCPECFDRFGKKPVKRWTKKKTDGPWTCFWDMHSGGGCKEPWSKIYIQAPKEEAIKVFYNRFGHNPYRVSCTCCGDDYSVSEEPDLFQATGYHRGCADNDGKGDKFKYIESPAKDYRGEEFQTLSEYYMLPHVMMIFKDDIKDEERVGDVPEQGYVWRD